MLEHLVKQPLPGGVEVQDAKKTWTGGRMDFAFKAKKGFFSPSISGTLDITDEAVTLDAQVPAIVTNFLGEERIRERITEELGRLLT